MPFSPAGALGPRHKFSFRLADIFHRFQYTAEGLFERFGRDFPETKCHEAFRPINCFTHAGYLSQFLFPEGLHMSDHLFQ